MAPKIGYLASPYTRGDKTLNVKAHCRMMDLIFQDKNLLAYAPLWSETQQKYYPQPEDKWISYDNLLIMHALKLDFILRINAQMPGDSYLETSSTGADKEVALVKLYHPNAIVVYQREEESYLDVLHRLKKKLAIGEETNE